MGLRGKQISAQFIELLPRKVGGSAMLVSAITRSHNVADCGGGAIVKIRGRTPKFDQSGCVKAIGGLVERSTRPDIMRMKIGKQAGRMANGTTCSLENL